MPEIAILKATPALCGVAITEMCAFLSGDKYRIFGDISHAVFCYNETVMIAASDNGFFNAHDKSTPCFCRRRNGAMLSQISGICEAGKTL